MDKPKFSVPEEVREIFPGTKPETFGEDKKRYLWIRPILYSGVASLWGEGLDDEAIKEEAKLRIVDNYFGIDKPIEPTIPVMLMRVDLKTGKVKEYHKI